MTDGLFVWVPKVAGTSIYKYLHPYGCVKLKSEEQARTFNNSGLVTFGHLSPTELKTSGIVTEEFLNKAFKFAFVRNPFDRLVSFYVYKLQKRKKPVSFEQLCNGLDNIAPIGLYNSVGWSQARPQSDWLFDEDRCVVDFVGRYENLQSDFDFVCDQLNVPTSTLPKKNVTRHKPYEQYYTPELADKVFKYYYRDFVNFGYKGEL